MKIRGKDDYENQCTSNKPRWDLSMQDYQYVSHILSFSFTRENYLQHHSENQKTQSAEAKLSPT